jgi:hypothetical protein
LGAPPAPPLGGEPEIAPPPPGVGEPAGEVTPESRKKDLNILVETNMIEGSEIINLGQAQDYLGEISKQLDKLLNS